jgi:hypothetical protein
MFQIRLEREKKETQTSRRKMDLNCYFYPPFDSAFSMLVQPFAVKEEEQNSPVQEERVASYEGGYSEPNVIILPSYQNPRLRKV